VDSPATRLRRTDHAAKRRRQRHVLGCPLAGLDADELIDASPLARRLQQAVVGRRFSNLPRKFNVAITGCTEDCIHAQTQDLAFVAARLNGVAGFNVNVPAARLDELLAEPLLETYSPSPSNWVRSLITCTGNDFCHFVQTDTKGDSLRLAATLEQRYELERPVRIQVSGCPHACGQHRAGEIGLLSGGVRIDGEVRPAATLFAGGRLGDNAKLAQEAAAIVSLDQLPALVADQVRALRGPSAIRRRRTIVTSKAIPAVAAG